MDASPLAATAHGPTVFELVVPFSVLLLVALAIPASMLAAHWLASRWLTGRHGAPAKGLPYESGIGQPVGDAAGRFPVKYYLVAMLFLAFDVEVAFLYPWAIRYGAVEGWGMLWAVLPFLLLLEAGFLYLWRKGALDWER